MWVGFKNNISKGFCKMTLTGLVGSIIYSFRNSSLYIENIIKSEMNVCEKDIKGDTYTFEKKNCKELYLKAIL